MKITMTLTEAKLALMHVVFLRTGQKVTSCRFIEKYSDGSGEGDIEKMVTVDRVELE